MTRLAEAKLTVPEAAYVAGVTEKIVNREIDARIMRVIGRSRHRAVSGLDVLYLGATRDVREDMSPQLRKRLHDAITTAVKEARKIAKLDMFELPIAAVEKEMRQQFDTLERMKRDLIESRAGVRAGEPVVKGTRIPARQIADLVRQGAKSEELQHEFDLTREQIEAAIIFDRVTPKRGRPRIRKLRVTEHVPADR
ncbi:Uncharacterized conserved protein, DUF433 family [Rhizobiales bacterium GAS191]|nr:Uncharacterized conserved protein, DUF433 family [Rhizobiales bacterium GAS191]